MILIIGAEKVYTTFRVAIENTHFDWSIVHATPAEGVALLEKGLTSPALLFLSIKLLPRVARFLTGTHPLYAFFLCRDDHELAYALPPIPVCMAKVTYREASRNARFYITSIADALTPNDDTPDESELHDAVVVQTALNDKLLAMHEELARTQEITIRTLAKVTEARDYDTGEHIERIPKYCKVLCKALRDDETLAGEISPVFVSTLSLSSLLHDIGKVAIPDSILLKAAFLSEAEFAVMKTHTTVGADIIAHAVREQPGNAFLSMAEEIARYHHENVDGGGYPEGLKGEDIPLAARIVALADVYDALTSARPYKRGYSHEEAYSIIAGESGKKFDPRIVAAFKRKHETFRRLRFGARKRGARFHPFFSADDVSA